MISFLHFLISLQLFLCNSLGFTFRIEITLLGRIQAIFIAFLFIVKKNDDTDKLTEKNTISK